MNTNIQKSPFINSTAPVVFIESVYEKEGEVSVINFSGMGFLYKKNVDNTFLLITCAHLFWPEYCKVIPDSRLLIIKDYGINSGVPLEDFLPFSILDGPHFSKNRNEDIALFKVVPKIQPKEDFKLFDPIVDYLQLTGTEGTFLVQSDENGIAVLISQASNKLYPLEKYNFRSRSVVLTSRGSVSAFGALSKGACRYPCFEIFSDVGASGSPVWTNDGKLLGMNLGGEKGVWTAVVTCPQIDAVIEELKW